MPSKLKKAIEAVKDQTSISLAKVSNNSSSNLEVLILKATTHEDVPIEDKYVHEALQLVSSNKDHAATCARAIGKRIGRTRNWVVALKSLMLVLRIFQDGDPYFPREVLHAMKRGAMILNLSKFRDDSNSSPWDFTSFVRTFALYLDERLECFLTGKLQRRYKHGADENFIYQRCRSRSMRRPNEPVSDMKPSMLLDKISYWQRLLERAIATRPTGAAKMNRLVQLSLYAVVQESFGLYKDISEGLTLLLDSFFHLQHQNCVNAFQTCVNASKQFEELSAFYSSCKDIGVGRSSEYPSVQTISEELIETLQEFLKDQSSFSSSPKPTNHLLLPAPPSSVVSPSSRHGSYGGLSDFSNTTDGYSERTSEFGSQDFGSQCTSLEDLIRSPETGASAGISTNLEVECTKSLPVSSSSMDLILIADWSDQDEKDQQQDEKKIEFLDSQESNNWELVLAETLSTSTTSSLPLSNNKTNDLNALPTTTEEKHHIDTTSNSTDGWELVLFEATPPQHPGAQQPTIPNNHYNPFLQDIIELSIAPNEQFSISAATFQPKPTFSALNPNQNPSMMHNENDPFACASVFSSESGLNSSINQENLLQEQQLWLQNQNKIIAKYTM